MFFYEVAIGSSNRGGGSIFTYQSSKKIQMGTCVEVSIKGKNAHGFVVKESTKPSYDTLSVGTVSPFTLPATSLRTFEDLKAYYPSGEQALSGLFLPPSITPCKKPYVPTPAEHRSLPTLNKEQRKVVDRSLASQGSTLIHGDTGVGKTRMYLHLAQTTLAQSNGSVLFLVPEIGLSAFLYSEIQHYFPEAILYHSKLTKATRQKIWEHTLVANTPQVFVGPRSVLGLPIKNIGLIITDESHDQSYRQANAPYVSAKVFASILAANHKAKVVYGSATPPVSEYYQMKKRGLNIERITKKAVDSTAKTSIKVIGYDHDNENRGGSLLVSAVGAIKRSVETGGQAMVLINRRGTARYIACQSCGHESRCTVCDRLLTYHHDRFELRCHHCEKKFAVPKTCLICSSSEIAMRSYGSKAVYEELTKLFPDTRIQRYDSDTIKEEHLVAHAEDIRSGDVQILVGTQMLAKGLDLPRLRSLVVLSGGSSDGYMSEEREFQLLYQVIGRAMRGHGDTEVVIQANNPDSSVLGHAIARDYMGFYEQELVDRKKFYYPPYCHMLLLHIRRKTAAGAQKAAESLALKVSSTYEKIAVSPATPNRIERIGPYYHWHILVKSPSRTILARVAAELASGFQAELDPVDIP